MGSIQISASGRYFVDASARPLFWLGDTQWELFRLFEPPTALRILDDRRRKGFNVILIMLLGVDTSRFGATGQPPYMNCRGQTPWAEGNPLKPNEAYFEHIDEMVRLGERTGQTFVVGVYHQWQEKIITPAIARSWARWVARRYRDVPNIIWSMYPKATDAFVPVCRELAGGLREGDGGSHLICVHPDPAVASSSFIHGEDWLAFNMIQTCTKYEQIHETVAADYGRTPVKPVVMAEGGYEGVEFSKTQTAYEIRQQAYWTQLAGGHHVYGHNDAWSKPMDWEQWLDSPGTTSLRVFREIVTSCEAWWDLVPDQSLFIEGVGSGNQLNVAARSGLGRWVLVYLSRPCTVSISLDAITASDQVNGWWLDPANGNREPAGTWAARGRPSFKTPADRTDALLFLEAR